MQLLEALHNIINNDLYRYVVIKAIVEVARPSDWWLFNKKKFSLLAQASSSIWDTTVRAYIGCEYECPRGHRFLCASPNHPVRVGANGVVKVRNWISISPKIFLFHIGRWSEISSIGYAFIYAMFMSKLTNRCSSMGTTYACVCCYAFVINTDTMCSSSSSNTSWSE